MVGWSGMLFRNMSSLLLKISTFSEVKFLISEGSKLNILAPLMARLFSQAFLTETGAFLTKFFTLHSLPRLSVTGVKSNG